MFNQKYKENSVKSTVATIGQSNNNILFSDKFK
jgi:hypothetical protein